MVLRHSVNPFSPLVVEPRSMSATLAMRAWCASLEEQQAQLAAVSAVVVLKVAGVGLTRFLISAALPDELPVHGQE